MNTIDLELALEDLKQEFLLLIQEERFDKADEVYQKYKEVKRELAKCTS
jgi:hypothetical protein